MPRTSFRLALIAPAALFCVASASYGQTTATISGVVTDPTGAVVPQAQIKVTGLATGIERSAVTDNAGVYLVPSLLPGDYKIDVQATGFGVYTVPKLQLDVDQKITVNAKLSVNSEGQSVQVSSAESVIVADTVTVGTVLDQRTVQELPLNGRHFLDLTVLTPGGVTAPTAGSLTAPSRGLGANSYITAGNREDSANFQINGVNLNDNSQNQITFQPSINTTSEFKIDNSTYSAEYGRSSGSIVNVLTKSGTNTFHGEVFDYNRNNSFDARNFFNPKGTAQNALKRNNFGGALGGPIFHDKAFFFGSYEGLRQHQTIVTSAGVLTTAQRNAVTAAGNPTAIALLALIPVANTASNVTVNGAVGSYLNKYVGSAPGPVNVDQYTGDVFYQKSAKDQFHTFYAFQKDIRTEPTLQGNNIPGFGDHRSAHRQVATLSYYHIFSPTLSNEARIGANRISIAFIPNVTTNPSSIGIGDGIMTNAGLPQITLVDAGTNFGGPSGFPQGRTDNLGLFNDTLTYLRGKHTFRVGGEYRRSVNNSFADDTGTLSFNSVGFNVLGTPVLNTAGTAQVGGFYNGMANVFSITPTAVNSRIFTNAAAGFIEDTYKIAPNFTAELGFRFEWNGTPTEGADRFVHFNLTNAQLERVHIPYNENYNYEPRVGLTWDPYGAGKTVFRGAYGIMADQPVSGVVTGLAGNPPFATGVSYSSATAPLPVATLLASASGSAIALSNVPPNFANAYTETFNFNVQQQMPQGILLNVGYYGSEGKHLRARTNANQPFANGTRPYTAISGASLYKPNTSLANANISQADDVSSSNYNALWATATKSLSHGMQFLFTYNWSKSLDENSLGSQGGYTFQDSTNPRGNYGLSDFDTRHRIAANAIYDIPNFGRALHINSDRVLGGFRLSGIEQWQTGNPVNIVNTSTFSGVSGVIRPNQVGTPVKAKIETTGGVTFFQAPTCTTLTATCVFQNTTNSFGTTRRNSVTGPGFSNLDMSLEKNTKLTERVNLQLRVDAFDLANHPSFASPTGNDTSVLFGQSTATRFPVADSGSSRQLQLVGKVTF